MNACIDHLNQWGAGFYQFARPMLWQSSLLIILLSGLDFVVRRRLRASLRYALWLVVLVKLCLPPTLALPTSPVWWFPKTSLPAVQTSARPFSVTYDQETLPEIPAPVTSAPAPRPALTVSAWLLLISAAVSLTLFVWLLARWAQISHRVRRAVPSARLLRLTHETQSQIGLRRPVQVRLTSDSMSPAVCGLFRPAILIPQSLAGNFTAEQLRAVLLHELIHLRRGDVWVNFAQALLQIVYWWHPLVWFANARVRRVREEAVDDAVVLALRDEADGYAPTLLAVAKLALRRPLVSLGLVGIMESRHALRQRIERLLDHRTPRRAGLTLTSLLGLLAFTAVAVPMGDPPTPPPAEQTDLLAAPDPTLTMTVNPEVFIRNIRAQAARTGHAAADSCTNILLDVLHDEGVDLGRPGGFKFNVETGEITTQSNPDSLEIFRRVIEQLDRPEGQCTLPLGRSSFHRRSVLIDAEFYVVPDSHVRTHIEAKTVFEDLKNQQFIGTFTADQLAAFKKQIGAAGLQPFMRPRLQTAHGTTADYFVGSRAVGAVTNGLDFDCRPVVVEGGVQLAFRAEIQGNGADNDLNLAGTVLRGTTLIADGCHLVAFPMTGAPSDNKRLVLIIGASVITNTPAIQASQPATDGQNRQMVSATQAKRDDQVRTLKARGPGRPQLHFKARFIEMPAGTHSLDNMLTITNADTDAGLIGVLNEKNFRAVLHDLDRRKDSEELAEPEATTTTGRQTQMHATQMVTIVTNVAFHDSLGYSNSITFSTGSLEVGPVSDLTARVLDDGATIDLRTTAQLTKFLGYDKPPEGAVGDNVKALDGPLPVILPKVSVQQASAHLKIWDNETVVLAKLGKHYQDYGQHYFLKGKKIQLGDPDFLAVPDPEFTLSQVPYLKPADDDKDLFVFITVTIVDAAGNRVHSSQDFPITQNTLPPQ